VLRTGTTRERLAVVREMTDKIEPAEARAVLKLYSGESDRVRWGLIRLLGELKIESATTLILSDLRSPFHAECAIEALGKIGCPEAYNAILANVIEHPEYAAVSLPALASTGKEKSIRYIRHYLGHEEPATRRAAVRALQCIVTPESLQALREQLCADQDEEVRGCLLSAIHSLQSSLVHDIEFQSKEILPKIHHL